MKLNFIFSLALVVVLSVSLSSCDYLEKREVIKEGNEVIAKIEKFKKDNGRLPESLEEVGIVVTEGGPFYTKKDSSRYTLLVAFGWNKSLIYDSATQKWERFLLRQQN